MGLDKFAVVVADRFLVAEFGAAFVGKSGVCRVTDGFSETQIVPSYMLDDVLSGFSVAPERTGFPVVLVPFHAELEAVRLVREEAAKLVRIESVGLPAFFHRINAMESGSFSMKLSQSDVTFHLDQSLTERLGLRDGDRLSFALSNDGAEFCLFYDPHGNDLSLVEASGELTATFFIAASQFLVASSFEEFSSHPIHVPFEIRDRRIHFLKADVSRNILFLSREQVVRTADAEAVVACPKNNLVEATFLSTLKGRLLRVTGDWPLYFPYG